MLIRPHACRIHRQQLIDVLGTPASDPLHFAVPGGGDRLLRVEDPEIEATSRAGAARSTASARPKLWITFAEGTPVTGSRRCAPTADTTPSNSNRLGCGASSLANTHLKC